VLMATYVRHQTMLVLNATAWFQREDFCAAIRTSSAIVAANEEDAFYWYANGVLLAGDLIPADILAELHQLCQEQHFLTGIVWLQNLKDDPC
jgi:hypothetical protein